MTIEEFSSIDLRVGKIIGAGRIEKSEKLVKIDIDLGSERRQIVAGIGKSYDEEELIGMQVVVVANLEFKKLMGIESQGMILAAESENGPVLLVPEKAVNIGAKIK